VKPRPRKRWSAGLTTAEIAAKLIAISKTVAPSLLPHMWAELSAARLRDEADQIKREAAARPRQ
jgi:hypothetical protein